MTPRQARALSHTHLHTACASFAFFVYELFMTRWQHVLESLPYSYLALPVATLSIVLIVLPSSVVLALALSRRPLMTVKQLHARHTCRP